MFSSGELIDALNYIYCLYKIGKKEIADNYNQLFKDVVLKQTNSINERLQERKLKDYFNSLHLQMKGESTGAIDLLNVFFSGGNLYQVRFPDLDPIFDSVRETDQFNLVMDKYRKSIEKQRDNFADYLSTTVTN